MIAASRARLTLLAGLSCLLIVLGGTPRRPAKIYPAPTEVVGSERGEAELRRAREIWEEVRHRTPPGVSWRAVEVENRRRNLELRAALLRASRASSPLHWRERGSFDQTGRTHVTAVGSDGTTLLVGTDHGGVFSGTPGSRRWVPRSDGLGIGVQSLVIVPGRPEVWIAANFTGPIYVSTNQGLTWSEAAGGPKNGERVARILRDPARPRTVYVIADSGPRYRLYRSDNGGTRFTVAATRKAEGLADIWIDRVRGGPLYLASRQQVMRSTDRGATFQVIGRLPVPAKDVVLAGSEAGAPTLYVAVRGPNDAAWNLFVSADGGRTWRAGSKLPDFWLTLTASIKNPRLVFAGGVNANRSTDAGRTFKPISQWYEYYNAPATRLHADLPGIDCVIDRGKEVFFFDTDGGTFVSEDGGRTVRNVTRFGLGNGQYYDILTSVNNQDLIAAGAQDQGYQVSHPGSGLLRFDQLYSGDYGSLTSSDGTHNRLYAAYPGFVLVQKSEGSGDLESFEFPAPPGARRHPWIPSLAADPDDPDAVYYADRQIWRVERQEDGTYVPEMLPHDFGPGEEPDYVTAFAISPADGSRWYAGTAWGHIWSSADGGRTWSPGQGLGAFFSVMDVLPSPTDPDVCYIAGSGYDGNPVYRTTDGGATWESHSQGLPGTMGDALAFDDPVRQELYAATEAGPFKYDEASGSWINLLGTEAPLTTYTDVEGVPAAGIVRFATYGRGIWDYDPRP